MLPSDKTRQAAPGDQTLIHQQSTMADTVHGNRGPDNVVADHFGPYEVVRLLAEGGMGQVYLCARTNDETPYAVKTVRVAEELGTLERFRREIAIGTAIDHPNVCRILDSGEEDDNHYLVMEYLEGQTLKQCIEEQAPMPLDAARWILRQVLEGLSAIHGANAVHRDLKPANVMLLQNGTVKILDLGISRVGGSSFTATGSTLGTPQFIAPEQVVDAKRVDYRADLFCVGLMAYQMLSGHLPYAAPNLGLMMMRIVNGDQTPLTDHRPDLPGPWLEWIGLLLRHNPAERFMSASEAAMMLDML